MSQEEINIGLFDECKRLRARLTAIEAAAKPLVQWWECNRKFYPPEFNPIVLEGEPDVKVANLTAAQLNEFVRVVEAGK